jgi:hypothetical protein
MLLKDWVPNQRADTGVFLCVLFSTAENGGDCPGIATAMDHGNHEQRLFIWCIGNEVLAYNLKSQ